MPLHYMDSAHVSKRLQDAGAPRELADALAQTTSERIVMSYNGLATREDIEALKSQTRADIELALARTDAKIENAK